MSIATDVSRIKGNITAALAAIADKGVTVPDGSTSDALASLIASIEAGGGGYEVSLGLINLAENSTTITFEHGLSKAPDYVSIFLPIGYSENSFANSLRTYYKQYSYSSIRERHNVYATRSSKSYAYHENSLAIGDVAFTIDDTTVTASECKFSADYAARTWMSGKPYMWICISGDVVFPL